MIKVLTVINPLFIFLMGWIKKKSLAVQILEGIAITGLTALAATSPYFGLNSIRGFKGRWSKEERRKFYFSIYYLDRRGYVKILKNNNGNMVARITRRGEQVIHKLNFDQMKLPKPEKWDGKWRVVIFDIPNSKSKNRLAFSQKLKELGFIMIQKSVWAYPFECYKELGVARKFYEIEKYATYLEAVEIEDELHWRGRFNLSPNGRSA